MQLRRASLLLAVTAMLLSGCSTTAPGDHPANSTTTLTTGAVTLPVSTVSPLSPSVTPSATPTQGTTPSTGTSAAPSAPPSSTAPGSVPTRAVMSVSRATWEIPAAGGSSAIINLNDSAVLLVRVTNNAPEAGNANLSLVLDGRPASTTQVFVPASGTAEARLHVDHLREPGTHVAIVRLNDGDAWTGSLRVTAPDLNPPEWTANKCSQGRVSGTLHTRNRGDGAAPGVTVHVELFTVANNATAASYTDRYVGDLPAAQPAAQGSDLALGWDVGSPPCGYAAFYLVITQTTTLGTTQTYRTSPFAT